MAKLKLKNLDYLDEIDCTPEELIKIINCLEEQKHSNRLANINHLVDDEVYFEKKTNLNNDTKDTQIRTTEIEISLPAVEDVVNYITSKKDFEHHTK